MDQQTAAAHREISPLRLSCQTHGANHFVLPSATSKPLERRSLFDLGECLLITSALPPINGDLNRYLELCSSKLSRNKQPPW